MKKTLAICIAMLVLAAVDSPATALDLTGTWEGTAKCSNFSDGTPKAKFKGGVSLALTQSGTDLNAQFSGLLGATYDGVAASKAGDPTKGLATLGVCSTTMDGASAGFGVGKAKTDPVTGYGKLFGTLNASEGTTIITCKFAVMRKSTTDPLVGGCPP